MRTLQIRSLSFPVVAVLMFAGNSVAQDRSTGVLTVPEVQLLVNRSEPGDHARLAAHFTALADRYAADAKRHTSMAQSFGGNPNRNLGTGMSAHCKRLASLNNQSAATVRELATYHQKLASGVSATPPTGGSRFEGGAGARVPTDKDLASLAAQANTPADHRAIEEYFQTLAMRYTAEAKEHATMAQAYRGLPRTTGGASGAAVHFDNLAKTSRESAKEATAAAEMHKQLARIPR
jgi:phytoene dehydrogenase-like protein